jgi:hypothetical protein
MYKAADYRCLKPEKDKVNIYILESFFKQKKIIATWNTKIHSSNILLDYLETW